jgi:hypothetical protein
MHSVCTELEQSFSTKKVHYLLLVNRIAGKRTSVRMCTSLIHGSFLQSILSNCIHKVGSVD